MKVCAWIDPNVTSLLMFYLFQCRNSNYTIQVLDNETNLGWCPYGSMTTWLFYCILTSKIIILSSQYVYLV